MYLGTHLRQLKVGLATFQKTRTLNLARFASSLVAMTPWLALNWFTSVLQRLTVYVMSAIRWVPPGVLGAEMDMLLPAHTWHPRFWLQWGRNRQLSWWRQCAPLGIRWDPMKTVLAHKVTFIDWNDIFVKIEIWPILTRRPLNPLYQRAKSGLIFRSFHFDGRRKVGNGRIFTVRSMFTLAVGSFQCVCQVSLPGFGPLPIFAHFPNGASKTMCSWNHYIKWQWLCT